MPLKVQNDLPARKVMEHENIFIMDETRAITQDIRPLQIAILNLMPLKEDTEIDLMRCLSNTPLQIELTFLTTVSYIGKNTPKSHLNQFYQTFPEVKNRNFDGLIITGAPVEQMEYEEVQYWDELTKIMDWSLTNVTSTLHICWGAQAGLYYHYGIHKYLLPEKLSGVFKHKVHHRRTPLVRGFDDVFYAPHSRYTGVSHEEILANPELMVLADSKEAGELILLAKDGRQIFVTGHLEYDRLTLDKEYKRDIKKGLPVNIPGNYYKENDPQKKPLLRWRGVSNALFSNWIDYYVYQATPYEFISTAEIYGR